VKKYWIYEGTPVELKGTEAEHLHFLTNNGHLAGCEVSAADYAAAQAAVDAANKSQEKRVKILQIADHDKQLQMIFDCLAKLQLNGVDISTEVSSFLGKRSQVK